MATGVRVRFAPSPTGLFHVGSYRTALFNYLFARQNGGHFILRIEDTDKTRSKPEFEENIIQSLKWLGLNYDEFFRQSERTEIYEKYLRDLIAADKAYLSREPAKEGGGEVELVRFRNPNKVVTFTDLIRGDVSFDTTELGDFVIAKNLQEPIFHLVVVVDDYEMGITHIIRGEDHISNTPRHLLIQEAIGAPTPQYAHIPLVLAPDRSKLSKRHGALAITDYREQGYLPAALVNAMAFLGWNPGTDQELMTLEELVQQFKLEQIQKSGAIFNLEKLNWYNREYLKKLSDQEFADLTHTPLALAVELKNRVTTLKEVPAALAEFQFLNQTPQPDKKLLKTTEFLPTVISLLEKIPEANFTAEAVKNAIWDFATEQGRGQVLWPMRVALTGLEKSADPFFVASLLGKTETLKRLNYAATL